MNASAAVLAFVAVIVGLRATPPPRSLVIAAGPERRPIPSWRPRSPAAHQRALDAALPDVLDLLVIGLQAGLAVGEAFRGVASSAPPAARAGLDELVDRLDRGERVVDALPTLVSHWGARALALVAAVSAAEVAGLPLTPTLDRIADDARAHRRRLAEADARRLPVRLAVPLVCCTLPSFVCIAIGPLVIGALSSLRSM